MERPLLPIKLSGHFHLHPKIFNRVNVRGSEAMSKTVVDTNYDILKLLSSVT